MKNLHLKVFMEGDEDDSAPQSDAPLPRLSGVLYERPNPDGTRKLCANCTHWLRDQTCNIHGPEIMVPPDAVCGYHVYGTPRDVRDEQPKQPVEPELSGLKQVRAGVSCDVCRYYEPGDATHGVCLAVIDDDRAPAIVEALGSCARWEERE